MPLKKDNAASAKICRREKKRSARMRAEQQWRWIRLKHTMAPMLNVYKKDCSPIGDFRCDLRS